MDLASGFIFLICIALIAFGAWERSEWSKERKELVQRLQAPEQAVMAYAADKDSKAKPVPPIALDDDEAFEKLRLEREGLVAGD